MTKSNIFSIPNGVYLTYFKPKNLDKIPYSLTFLGTMDAFSNQQAIYYFIQEIFPIVKRNIPLIKLFIIGKNPPDKILELHDGINIIVTGIFRGHYFMY